MTIKENIENAIEQYKNLEMYIKQYISTRNTLRTEKLYEIDMYLGLYDDTNENPMPFDLWQFCPHFVKGLPVSNNGGYATIKIGSDISVNTVESSFLYGNEVLRVSYKLNDAKTGELLLHPTTYDIPIKFLEGFAENSYRLTKECIKFIELEFEQSIKNNLLNTSTIKNLINDSISNFTKLFSTKYKDDKENIKQLWKYKALLEKLYINGLFKESNDLIAILVEFDHKKEHTDRILKKLNVGGDSTERKYTAPLLDESSEILTYQELYERATGQKYNTPTLDDTSSLNVEDKELYEDRI